MKQLIKLSNELSKYSSTLLIPKKDLNKIVYLTNKYGSIRNFMHKAILSKHWLLGIKARNSNGKKLYQEKVKIYRELILNHTKKTGKDLDYWP